MRKNLSTMAAWSVHLLTALGAVCGLLALYDAGRDRLDRVWIWVGVALLIDGVDGALARRLDVARRTPRFDGARLDDMVDFLNYAILPAYLIVVIPILPPVQAWSAAVAVCLASAYQFGQRDSKTADRFFRGFPSYWNLVVFYLVLLHPPTWISFPLLLLLCVLAFVPTLYVYPTRTRELRDLTLAATALWGVAIGALFLIYPRRPSWLVGVALIYPIYYFGLSVALDLRRRRARRDRLG